MLLPWMLWITLGFCFATEIGGFPDSEMKRYKEKVRKMFYHAYNGYLDYAFPYDELKPITCKGTDTWGSFSLTLIDALDTLLVMGNATEFKRAVEVVLNTVDPEANVNVSVFETNIRVVGGLLTAHMLSGRVEGMDLDPGWPCSGPLLNLAERMASRLLPAFNTDTGMPFGTVNLKYGVHKTETPITCTAGVGTYLVEFGALSRLTGDPQYEKAALRAMDAVWKSRSPIGLVGNHINVQTGVWTATDSGIGAGVDSYFEYLVKGSLLLQKPNLMDQFYKLESSINKHVRKDDWFMWVSMTKATVSLPIFQSLEAFWPGILTMIGKVEDASRIMLQYSQLIRQYGMPPEFYNLNEQEPVKGRAAFPLRPEMVESLMYLYRATNDRMWLELGAQMVDAIESSAKTRCGYATVNKVNEHNIEDRMESFFLAETTKYLYLLFDSDNFLHNDGSTARVINTPNGECVIEAGGYIYNTEAHPIDPAILHCCSTNKQKERESLNKFSNNIDMVSLLHLNDGSLRNERRKKKTKKEGKIIADSEDVPSNDASEYIKRQYGNDELEYEVDESLKGDEGDNSQKVYDYQGGSGEAKNEKKEEKVIPKEGKNMKNIVSSNPQSMLNKMKERPEVIQQIRDMIRKARVLDDEQREKGNKESNIAERLMKAFRGMFNDYKDKSFNGQSVDQLGLDDMKVLLSKRNAASNVNVVIAECENCCLPLEFVGDSCSLRTLLSTIYKNYIYPFYGIPYSNGPICFPKDVPSERDNYTNDIPDNSLLSIAGDVDSSDIFFDISFFMPDFKHLEHLQYSLLTAPIPGFESRFSGMGFVSRRKNGTETPQ